MAHFSTRLSQQNRILHELPDRERAALLAVARHVRMPAGFVAAAPGDPLLSAYFPETGVLSLVGEMTTGHQVALDLIGRDDAVGLDALCGAAHYRYRVNVLAESRGWWIAADRVVVTFEQSAALRRVLLRHLGRRIDGLLVTAACNRVHSNRQRLARWLLVATDATGQRSLNITHEMLAQLVGGPRHAVTVALNDLRQQGAISHLRGRLEIVARSVVMQQACECYRGPARSTRGSREPNGRG